MTWTEKSQPWTKCLILKTLMTVATRVLRTINILLTD
jgi:hypothetical protein